MVFPGTFSEFAEFWLIFTEKKITGFWTGVEARITRKRVPERNSAGIRRNPARIVTLGRAVAIDGIGKACAAVGIDGLLRVYTAESQQGQRGQHGRWGQRG